MSAFILTRAGTAVAAALLLGVACTDDPSPAGLDPGPGIAAASQYPAPGGQVTAAGFTFYPYTLNYYEAPAQDPINLIFTGNVDPRMLRAALLALPNGDRSAFGLPNVFPLNCTWQDALGGDEQVANAGGGWTASVVQLACGDYGPVRMHLRLFPAGDRTVGNAHFELLIPNTADHRVLSWELAEQLVTVDFVRAGLVAYPGGIGVAPGINAAPTFRWIEAEVWAGVVAFGLDQLVYPDIPPITDVDGNVGMPTDGNATVLNVAGQAALVPGTAEQTLTLVYDIVIPKPVCATAEVPYIYVQGPVHFRQTDALTATGEYSMEFTADGELSVTPIDLSTGQPDFSQTHKALVRQRQSARFWPGMASVTRRFTQAEIPPIGWDRGRAVTFLQFGPNGKTEYRATERCAP
ncbi:MAG: hypothetical protein OER21_06280 [Gemmatimonadota bacterium]|nr:hypothetical protein [Gemmatimonadota bacterium]